MFNILPDWMYNKIACDYVLDYVYEIRLRVNRPIVINYKGCYKIITNKEGYAEVPIIANFDLINYIIAVSTKQSFYAYNNQIKQGFITTDNGIRIGLCGTVVYDKGEIATIKDITSLNIRISHQVANCSDKIINLLCVNDVVKNTLIISPPGAGKTTLVRDVVTKLSNDKKINNILVVDERFEIAGNQKNNACYIGDFVDVISGSDKWYAFNEGLKTMAPRVMVTDEVSKEQDIESIKQAIKSGVKVIATAHAENINELKFKKYFSSILNDKYFERIVVLSKRQGVGTIEGVFDENLRGLYLPYILWKS